jgi:hypothetical protein
MLETLKASPLHNIEHFLGVKSRHCIQHDSLCDCRELYGELIEWILDDLEGTGCITKTETKSEKMRPRYLI